MQFKNWFIHRFLRDERGQSAVMVAVTITGVMALAATSVETGHIYYAYRSLVASTNAATLAGAQAMPDTTTAAANVSAYSSVPKGKNATPMLQETSTSVTTSFLCLKTVSGTLNVGCQTPPSGTGSYNAIRVTQKATVNLWFGGLIGLHSMNLTAVSTAAMRGGTNTPWNIAIVLDTTKSMSDSDKGAQCTGTQISCALQGMQALLLDLDPCPLGESCASTSSYADAVSVYVFPPVLKSTAGLDWCSGGSGNPMHEYYEVPTLPTTWTYQIIPYSNNYRTSDASSTLNTASNLVLASGASSGCAGIQAPGGAGTYYAQAIYTAQADLVAQQKANPGSENAMIILSDGDASASGGTDLIPSVTGLLNGLLGNNSYTYPSALGECGQAVQAANDATAAGTTVYTIGYGAETSGGCTSDKTYSVSLSTGGVSWGPGDQPCQALAAMASAPADFFSDDGDGCQATTPSNAAITKLTAIFQAIADGITAPRLIPNSTT